MSTFETMGIVAVGDGRRFVVADKHDMAYIITASHCLPHLPPAIGGISYTHERTYQASHRRPTRRGPRWALGECVRSCCG
jgi:hypothetical protein